MNAPRSSGPRAHDHDGGRQEGDTHHQPESRAQEPLAADAPAPRSTPSTPGELVAMQRLAGECPPPPPPAGEARVAATMALLREQALNPWESQQIALALLRELETYHQAVVAEMHTTPAGSPAQMACWAIDGDRLMHCRRLLESITLI